MAIWKPKPEDMFESGEAPPYAEAAARVPDGGASDDALILRLRGLSDGYPTNAHLPQSVHTLPEEARDVWRIAYNNSAAAGRSPQTATAAAWAAVRRGWDDLRLTEDVPDGDAGPASVTDEDLARTFDPALLEDDAAG